MATGIVLLGFIAVLAAFIVVRTRRRLGLISTGRTYLVVITGFVILVLALWATARG
ncbi:MAG TPA: hypothetical protein VGI64_03155 [Streptosporangiaceae bacterium]